MVNLPFASAPPELDEQLFLWGLISHFCSSCRHKRVSIRAVKVKKDGGITCIPEISTHVAFIHTAHWHWAYNHTFSKINIHSLFLRKVRINVLSTTSDLCVCLSCQNQVS